MGVKMFVLCASLGLVGAGMWGRGAAPVAPADAADAPEAAARRLLVERPWIDQLPGKELKTLHLYFFIPEEIQGHYFGFFDEAPPWRSILDVFHYDANDDSVAFNFKASGEKVRTADTIKREKNGDFDLALRLKTDPGRRGSAQTYFSKVEWNRRDRVPAEVLQLVPAAAYAR